ncbi:MAG: hypothetical protein FWF92_11020 [Oscillospiraceae bacterium]|nr:hypothetical protein [Oscillospiraceae bacterium]
MNKKKSGSLNTTKKIALSAILSALGVIFLAIGSFIDVLDLSSAAIAGFVIVIAVIELGGHYPVMMYFVISILSVLVLPNKYPALFFIFFGGFYPIFKASIERFHFVIAWAVKFSMFNIFLAFLILVINFLIKINFMPSFESLENDSLYKIFENFKIIVFIVANFVFLLYDIAMTRIINLYLIKIRKLIGLKNYF